MDLHHEKILFRQSDCLEYTRTFFVRVNGRLVRIDEDRKRDEDDSGSQ